MSRLSWEESGSRFYEYGVDRGVVFLDESSEVWNGLISVEEAPDGGEITPLYLDGLNYCNIESLEAFRANVSAFTIPHIITECSGIGTAYRGLKVHNQPKKTFNFSYRTMVGNDVDGELGYKIHLVYNAMVVNSSRTNTTKGDSTEPIEYSWEIFTRPTGFYGFMPASHLVISSIDTPADTLSVIEDLLYGTDLGVPKFPTLDEVISAYDNSSSVTLRVTDLGDGSFTVEGPDSVVVLADDNSFTIDWPSVTVNPRGTGEYKVESL